MYSYIQLPVLCLRLCTATVYRYCVLLLCTAITPEQYSGFFFILHVMCQSDYFDEDEPHLHPCTFLAPLSLPKSSEELERNTSTEDLKPSSSPTSLSSGLLAPSSPPYTLFPASPMFSLPCVAAQKKKKKKSLDFFSHFSVPTSDLLLFLEFIMQVCVRS